MDIDTIARVWPGITARVAHAEFGTLIVLTGRGCKSVANHLAKENYLNGRTDTLWRAVRHGLGYAIPLYSNPLDTI